MVTVRRARPDDEPAILDLHVASIRGLGPTHYDAAQVDAWATKDDPDYRIEAADRHVVVAEVDDEVVGFGALDRDEREVGAVYVHPDHVRRGVGTTLLSRLEAVARDAGLARLALWSSLNAVAFYERHGYRAVETAVVEKRGEELEVRLLEKDLAGTLLE